MNIEPVASLKAAWPMVQRNPAALIGGFVVVAVLNVAVQLVQIPIISQIVGFVVSIFLAAGYMAIALNVYDNKPAAIGDLFKPVPQLTNMLAVNFITSVIVTIGFFFLIIPGLLLAMLLGFAPLLVLEHNLAPMDALQRSVAISRPLLGKLFFFAIVAGVLNFAGMIPAGLGLLVTAPMTMMAWIAIYRQVTAPAGGRRRRGTGPVLQKTEFAEN